MADKKKDLRQIADADLRKELDVLVKGLFNLRVRKVTDVVENPASFGQSRRQIARIRTLLAQRAAGAPVAPKAATAPAPAPVAAAPAKKAEPKVKPKAKSAAKPKAPAKK